MASRLHLLTLESLLSVSSLGGCLPLLLLVLTERSDLVSPKKVTMVVLSPGISGRDVRDLSLGPSKREIISIVFAIKVPGIVNH